MLSPSATKPDMSDIHNVEERLFDAAKDRISSLYLLGVASGCEDLDEPEKEHVPGLINMEEYEDWTRDATTFAEDKRIEKGQLVFSGSEMEVKDIFSSVYTRDGDKKHCRHAMIIASAGMGKTTLLKKIAHDGFEGKFEMLKGKLVLLPELRAFSQNVKIPPSQVFLDGLFSGNDIEQINNSYQWMLDNPQKVVFVIDSLDTLPFDFEQERPRILPHETATLDVILHNLLTGDLFKDSSIVSSSREHKVRNLHPSVRPDRCILLDGLKRDSVEDLIDGFVGEENGRQIKEHINSECPDIWPLLAIPVLLVCSVISFLRGGFRPKTMTGILLKYLVGLIDSSRSENMAEVLPKFMSLSFLGIQNGHVLFQPEELMRFGLKPDEVTDLGAAIVPAGQRPYILSKLMQSDRYFLYFNHQTVQECLAALHILSMKTEEFRGYVKSLNKPRFSIVRRLVCGILLNPEVRSTAAKLVIITDVERKEKILLNFLKDAIRGEQRSYKKDGLLELIVDLNEAKDGATDLIRSTLKKINLSFIQLTESNVQAIASVLSRCERLEEIRLNNCNINAKKMDILTRTILKSSLKVCSLHLGVNDLGRTGMMLLSKLAKHCEVKILGIYGCSLESERVKAFLEGSVGLKLVKLYASNNAAIGTEGMFYLGKLVQLCQPEEFGVRNCKLTSECIKKFAEGASDTKLNRLDVSVNKELGTEGMSLLGTLVKKGLVKDIMAAGCNLKSDELQSLIQSLGSTKIRSLDVNDYSNKPIFNRFVLDLVSCVEKELDLRHWVINEDQRKDIMQRKNDTGSKVRILLLSEMKHGEESLGTFKSGKKIVSSDGGEIELGGCIVRFPPGGLVHDAYIEFYLEICSISNQPAKTVAISPAIACDFSHVGIMPGFEVEVEMRSYCFAEIPLTTSLMAISPDSGKWNEEREMILGRDRKLKFKTSATSFQKYFAFKRGTGNGWAVTFPVIPVLHCDKFGNFRSFLTLDDRLITSKLNLSSGIDVLASAVDEVDPLVMKFGDSIGTELRCIHPSAATFGDDNQSQFTADELIRNIYLQRDFHLKNVPTMKIEGGVLKVHFSWEKNRPFPERKTSECHIKWPPSSGILFPVDAKVSLSEEKPSVETAEEAGLDQVGREQIPEQDENVLQRASVATTGEMSISEQVVLNPSCRTATIKGRMTGPQPEKDAVKTEEEVMAWYGAMVEKICNTIARKTKNISPDGGEIELHGCRIRFPPGAVDHPTDVEIFTDNDPKHYPEFATPICLIFGCKPSRFKVPVEVTVSTWFKPMVDSTASVSLFVHSSSTPVWRILREVDVSSTGEITYNVSHFCEHNAGILYNKNPNGSYEFFSDVWIHNQSARIIPFFCKRDQKFLEGVRKELELDHTRIISLTEEPEIFLESTIKMAVDWENPNTLSMKTIGKNPIKITENELRKNKIHCYFKPIPDLTRLNHAGLNELSYSAEVRKANGKLDGDASFESPLSFTWPLVRLEGKKEGATRNVVQNIGTVNAENFFGYCVGKKQPPEEETVPSSLGQQ